MEEIRVKLRGTMGGKHHYLIDDDDEEEGDEDVHMYPADVHPNEQQKLVNGTEIRLQDL